MSTDAVARLAADEFGRVPENYDDLVELAGRFARERLAGRTVLNHATQLAITLSPESLRAATRHGVSSNLLMAVPALPAMLTWGRYARTTDPQDRGNTRRRYVLTAIY